MITHRAMVSRNRNRPIKIPLEDKIFYTISYTILIIVLISMLYPLIYIVASSFSSSTAVSTGKVILWPVDFSLEGYALVFNYRDIWRSYANTIFYTTLGTSINVVITVLAAYPLSRRDLPGRNFIMLLFAFTMIFGGGLIPYYILIRNLGMYNTFWVMVIPGALSVFNMIIMRTSIQANIPKELLEASQMDGCSDIKYLTKVVLPLSKASIAVIVLFYAVGHWNAFFNGFLFLSNRSLYPLQLILREILITNQLSWEMVEDPEILVNKQNIANLLKYSLIIVATLPVLAIYPFIQKYFVKGVMIGSIKG